MAGEKIDMVTGVGNALQTKGGRAAESITSGFSTVVEGVERGVMKGERKVDVDASLAVAGLSVTKVQDSEGDGASETYGLQAYVIAKTAADGTLRMLAYDVLAREIGRSSVHITFAGDDAKYFGLPLDKQVKLRNVAKVTFTFIPGMQVAAK